MELEERNLINPLKIYRDVHGRVKVFFASLVQGRELLDVAVKAITCSGSLELYSYIEECLNQMKIDSENVCRMYGWVIKPKEIYIVMERLPKEISLRRKAEFPYTETELLQLLLDMTVVFASLQRQNISHNDIKAENIFEQKLAHGNVVFKVGDFGSAAKAHRWERTLTGTPLYLSPHLKVEYQRYLRTRERREIIYDPFRSDVYSLGVTLIYLAELVCPNDLMDTQYLQNRIEAHLTTVRQRYPKLAGVMRYMLETDEAKRYDFLQLEEKLVDMSDIPNTNVADATMSLKAHRFVADFTTLLQQCYQQKNWDLLEVLLKGHSNHLQCLRAETHLPRCPTCASIPKPESEKPVCVVCGRPTGFPVPYAKSFPS